MDRENKDENYYYSEEAGFDLFGFMERGLLPNAEYKGAIKFNVIKYILRAEDKHEDPIDQMKDIEKAIDYCQEYKRVLYNEHFTGDKNE